MRKFGSDKPIKDLTKEVEINGEVFKVYAKLPASVVKTSRDFTKYIDSMSNPETGEIDDDKFDGSEYNAALYDLLPSLLPEETAQEIVARMSGEKAPILEPPVMVEFASWLLQGMPEEAVDEIEETSGKAASGRKTSTRSASQTRTTQK